MQAKLDKSDCMFLISDEKLNQFQQMIDELDLFTLVLPFVEESYQRSIWILDIWYSISNEEINRISNPENTMIYPYRNSILGIIKTLPIKRYIQLALYENERLAFLCAIYIYNELDDFISKKMAIKEEVKENFDALKKYSNKSLRPFFDSKYIEYENYPKKLAMLQNTVVNELHEIHKKYEIPLSWTFEKAIDDASKVYEAVFGLINDWGGRVP
ncbi:MULTISPECIES: ATPase [Solibacillus]|uniref:ATPase n=1 Tax=Solibacillus merdavium TaxID=2762218 RepID=A0ABR8XRE9_9BACL|nr:ATPase [Solibacillus merdavium]MBD8034515.1 ATPase [Solibacillus merdavium]